MLLEWGSCGKLMEVDGVTAGYILYAPPAYVPRSVAFPTSPVSPDAVLLMTAHVLPEFTGGGRGGTVVNLGNGSYISYGLNKLEAKKVTFAALMDSLSKFVDRPIVDMTELKGRYDMTLEYSVEELRSLVRASGADASRIPDFGADPTISIFSSLEAIGLKLEPRKAPVEVLVIDRAERVPTAN